MATVRIEKDSLGEVEVPVDACYGAQTARALSNFPISGIKSHHIFVLATVYIKKAAAEVNTANGRLPQAIGSAIIKAADRVINSVGAIRESPLQDQFVVDVFQAGAGTSHHMNVNEVLANIAIESLGGKKGDYSIVHPNDHVNYGQSTNDVYPTAMRIAALLLLKELFPILDELVDALQKKAEEFDEIIKSGRTHLQDAVPIRLGQEFSGYAEAISKSTEKIEKACDSLKELGIGGSAVGTGLNTYPEYADKMVKALRGITGLDLRKAVNRFEAMQSNACFTEVSGALRNLAVELIRISNDLRLLSSGPRTGLAEINLPPLQPGSSIMPGKVNPVMAEMLAMVCFAVIGNDLTITMAAQAGQLELNVMMPVIQYKLLESIEILTNALKVFTNRGVSGITANNERCNYYAMNTMGLATALNPYIGYAKASEVAKESLRTGKSIKDIVLEKGLLTESKLNELLSPASMTEPRRQK